MRKYQGDAQASPRSPGMSRAMIVMGCEEQSFMAHARPVIPAPIMQIGSPILGWVVG
jgi:hypothetical protein